MYNFLYRSHKNKLLCGVLGGLGEYLYIDPSILRTIFMAILIFSNQFYIILAYILGAIILTKDPKSKVKYSTYYDSSGKINYYEEIEPETDELYDLRVQENKKRKLLFGVIMFALGLVILVDNILKIDRNVIISTIIILFGFITIFGTDRRGY